jgi:hypothetical protein
MPKTKVANPRDKRELHISRGVEEVDADHEEWLLYQQQQQPHTQSGRVPMLSGLNREREMSAMVSALTHVVSGEVPFGFVDESDLTQSLASGSGWFWFRFLYWSWTQKRTTRRGTIYKAF